MSEMKRSRALLVIGALVLVALPLRASTAAAPTPAITGSLRPLIQDVTGWVDQRVVLDAHVPIPEGGDGIGPGSRLVIHMPGGSFLCTANFIFTDGVKQYMGTAGHCLLPSGKTSTHGSDADYTASNTTVEVCIASCLTGGWTGFLTGTDVTLGPATYARQNFGGVQVGNDFGIVEIPSSLAAYVRPSMPMWGGPSGIETNSGGKAICHFGNGVFVGETLATKGRVGYGLGGNASMFSAVHVAYGGDSGSAINTCAPDSTGIHGIKAVGVLTHGTIDPVVGAVPLGQIRGTTTTRAIQMATDANLTLGLVTGP